MREHGRLGPIEWAAASRPRPGEHACGDQAIAVDIDGASALFGVLDGLGHGPAAAAAALTARETLEGARGEQLEALVQLCHRVLGGTRGVTMTLAHVDFPTGQLSWTGIGNVSANLVAKAVSGIQIRSAVRLTGGIVGYRIPEISPTQVVSLRTGDLLVIASDGVTEDYLDHIDFAAGAKDIAEHILTEHTKETDDALVLAARHRGSPT